MYQSEVANIYAAGDVIGFPSLASTPREQGRIASCHAFGIEAKHAPELFPYGIYTIPEISFVGQNEEQRTDKGVPYEVGKAQYRDIARGQIVGDTTAMLKTALRAQHARIARRPWHRTQKVGWLTDGSQPVLRFRSARQKTGMSDLGFSTQRPRALRCKRDGCTVL